MMNTKLGEFAGIPGSAPDADAGTANVGGGAQTVASTRATVALREYAHAGSVVWFGLAGTDLKQVEIAASAVVVEHLDVELDRERSESVGKAFEITWIHYLGGGIIES